MGSSSNADSARLEIEILDGSSWRVAESAFRPNGFCESSVFRRGRGDLEGVVFGEPTKRELLSGRSKASGDGTRGGGMLAVLNMLILLSPSCEGGRRFLVLLPLMDILSEFTGNPAPPPGEGGAEVYIAAYGSSLGSLMV
jgi:hypothetical protein